MGSPSMHPKARLGGEPSLAINTDEGIVRGSGRGHPRSSFGHLAISVGPFFIFVTSSTKKETSDGVTSPGAGSEELNCVSSPEVLRPLAIQRCHEEAAIRSTLVI